MTEWQLSKSLFKERMTMIRDIADQADSVLAEFMYREMLREIQKLAAKFRTGNTFIQMPVVPHSEISIVKAQKRA